MSDRTLEQPSDREFLEGLRYEDKHPDDDAGDQLRAMIEQNNALAELQEKQKRRSERPPCG